MSGPAFVRMYPSDWRSGCLGLNLEQEGLYVRICMFIAEVGRRVPLDDSQAARMLNCQTKQYRRILGELLVLGKVKRHDDGYGNDRIELERRKAANAKHTAATERSPDREADQGQYGENSSPAMNGKSAAKVDQIGGETELKLERNSIETELQLPVPPQKIMENQCPSKRAKTIVKESEEVSPPNPQPGACDDQPALPINSKASEAPSNVKPVTDWKTAFAPTADHGVVVVGERITLVNGTRALWLERFGGDAVALDLSLESIELQPHGRHSIAVQVNRGLARIARERHDRDRRYRDASTRNASQKPALGQQQPSKRTLADVLREADAREAAGVLQ